MTGVSKKLVVDGLEEVALLVQWKALPRVERTPEEEGEEDEGAMEDDEVGGVNRAQGQEGEEEGYVNRFSFPIFFLSSDPPTGYQCRPGRSR